MHSEHDGVAVETASVSQTRYSGFQSYCYHLEPLAVPLLYVALAHLTVGERFDSLFNNIHCPSLQAHIHSA